MVGTAKRSEKYLQKLFLIKFYYQRDSLRSKLYESFLVNPKKARIVPLIRKIIGLTGDIDKTQEFQKANMNLRVYSY